MQGTTLMTHKLTGKQLYWSRRRAGERGQGTLTKAEVIPAGQEAGVPNASGSYFSGMPGKGFSLNRKQARRRFPDRDATKPNVEYRKTRDESPFKGHMVNRANHKLRLPALPTDQTNHQRMLTRKLERIEYRATSR